MQAGESSKVSPGFAERRARSTARSSVSQRVTSWVGSSAAAITSLVLRARCDDGFNAWINGVHVAADNVSGENLPATATADFYLRHTPTDGIPYWDTGAPGLGRLGDYLDRPQS